MHACALLPCLADYGETIVVYLSAHTKGNPMMKHERIDFSNRYYPVVHYTTRAILKMVAMGDQVLGTTVQTKP